MYSWKGSIWMVQVLENIVTEKDWREWVRGGRWHRGRRFGRRRISIGRRHSCLCDGGRWCEPANVTFDGIGIRVSQAFRCGMNVFELFVGRKVI